MNKKQEWTFIVGALLFLVALWTAPKYTMLNGVRLAGTIDGIQGHVDMTQVYVRGAAIFIAMFILHWTFEDREKG